MSGKPVRVAAASVALALGGQAAGAAEVALVKSVETAAWAPAIAALRRMTAGHAVTEYDLRNDRAQGAAVLGPLKGRPLVVVAMGPVAAQAAREVLPDAPLVFCMVLDPPRAGLSIGPGVTGVSFRIPVKNQLAAYRMVYPRGTRLGVLYNEANVKAQVEEAEKAAGLVRLIVVSREVSSERDVPAALRALLTGADAVDALWLPADPMLLGDATRRFLLSESLKAGKPVFSFSAALVAEGALASNGPDYSSIGEQAGELVNRVAAGEKRIEMLVPRAELVVNTRIAAKLRIDIPADALRAARKF
jgi:putative ABC transport system substrate-binding protein